MAFQYLLRLNDRSKGIGPLGNSLELKHDYLEYRFLALLIINCSRAAS